MRIRSLSTALALTCLAAVPALAQVTLTPFYSGLDSPVFLTGEGNNLFVAQLNGTIVSIDRTTKAAQTFFTVPDLASGGENGLLGMAFDPNYASNGRYYVDVTTMVGGVLQSEVRRYTNPAIATEVASVILRIDQSASDIHKGGWLGFGGDGNLYVATGDGGPGYDPNHRAQDLTSLLGKMLRIDVSADAFPADPVRNYTVPASNPFGNEIFAYGLRNPYRDSFDAATGDLYIGDVGQSTYEEVDRIAAGTSGQNFGWRPLEGTVPTPGLGDPIPPGTTPPVLEYGHVDGDAAIVGGYVYRGSAIPSLFGRYVFGDYVSGHLWSMALDGSDKQALSADLIPFLHPSSFGQDSDNNLYVVDLGGRIFELTAPADAVPEPASWAMFVTGLGMAGAALRQRRRRPAVVTA